MFKAAGTGWCHVQRLTRRAALAEHAAKTEAGLWHVVGCTSLVLNVPASKTDCRQHDAACAGTMNNKYTVHLQHLPHCSLTTACTGFI